MGASRPIALPVNVIGSGSCDARTGEVIGFTVRVGGTGPGSCTLTLAAASTSSMSVSRARELKKRRLADAPTKIVIGLSGRMPASGEPVTDQVPLLVVLVSTRGPLTPNVTDTPMLPISEWPLLGLSDTLPLTVMDRDPTLVLAEGEPTATLSVDMASSDRC